MFINYRSIYYVTVDNHLRICVYNIQYFWFLRNIYDHRNSFYDVGHLEYQVALK